MTWTPYVCAAAGWQWFLMEGWDWERAWTGPIWAEKCCLGM